MRPRARHAAPAAALIAVAAFAASSCATPGPRAKPDAAREARITLVAELLGMEDRRSWDPDLAHRAASSPDPRVRERAAFAAGRIRDEEAAPLLRALLADPVSSVRLAAAFACGVSSLSSLVPALRPVLSDPHPGAAAEAATALGRLGGPEAEEALRTVLAGRTGPRAAAAAALFRAKDDASVSLLSEAALRADLETRRAATWALARAARPSSAPALRELAADDDPQIAAWSARGLGLLEDAGSAGALLALAKVREPGPAIQSLGALDRLAAKGKAAAEARAAAIARSRDPHPGIAVAALTLLRRSASDAGVRAELESIVAGGGRRGGVALASLAAGDADRAFALSFPSGAASPLALRLGAAESLPLLPEESLGRWLEALLSDPVPRVRMEAVSRVPRPLAARHAPLIGRALADPDGSVAAAALDASAPVASGRDAEPLVAKAWRVAYDTLLRSGEADLIASALDAAASLAEGGRELLAARRDDPDHLVRERARRLLAERFGEERRRFPRRPVAARLAGSDYRRLAERAEGGRSAAIVETTRGTFTIELDPSVAPMTVDSFAALARKGFFDGIAIHRVVPDFVVQTGDPRGDGTGGPGYALRDELNPLPYVRGRVGMALSGPDTGGSQWFVTLSRQPHLDGAYTVFGEVSDGMDVLDRIEQDDRLLAVRVREADASPAAPRR